MFVYLYLSNYYMSTILKLKLHESKNIHESKTYVKAKHTGKQVNVMYAEGIQTTDRNHFCAVSESDRRTQMCTDRQERPAAGHMRAQDCRSERRIRRNRLRRQQEMKKRFRLFLMTVFLIATCSFTLSAFRSNAKNEIQTSGKYYKSITVTSHDTLWSIAQQYMDETHYDTVNDYINEVRYMNSLTDDSIHYGEYLVIPYFENDPD